ncbi:hypothetical protein [Sulfitobacter sp. SK012]|uniref:hypothetical protein n=1 Tax=Sulfitobacter sp. SK012 TaxID=1389005 RepID=UPI001C1FC524|nr:hypothetical protein [Sulfitobacter sp. SK012]
MKRLGYCADASISLKLVCSGLGKARQTSQQTVEARATIGLAFKFPHQFGAVALSSLLLVVPQFGTAQATPHAGITAFNKWCFKAGQTEAQARRNMNTDEAPFSLTFWGDSLAPRPLDAPRGVERRCEVTFDGDHSDAAIAALRAQMAQPPVFGTPISLPDTHEIGKETALIEGRELVRGRVAVVHVGTQDGQTFIAVDRLYAGLKLQGSSN